MGILIGTVHGVTHFHMAFLPSLGNSIFLSLIGAFIGPSVGLISTDSYFVWQFKFGLALALLLAVILIRIGISGRLTWWRYLLGIIGINLWMIAGLMGFWPQ
ncbi:MAG: hypothetical protein PHF31_10820 [Methylobacter sp.]|nr:hypothetical protein [Methylobacter sp.]